MYCQPPPRRVLERRAAPLNSPAVCSIPRCPHGVPATRLGCAPRTRHPNYSSARLALQVERGGVARPRQLSGRHEFDLPWLRLPVARARTVAVCTSRGSIADLALWFRFGPAFFCLGFSAPAPPVVASSAGAAAATAFARLASNASRNAAASLASFSDRCFSLLFSSRSASILLSIAAVAVAVSVRGRGGRERAGGRVERRLQCRRRRISFIGGAGASTCTCAQRCRVERGSHRIASCAIPTYRGWRRLVQQVNRNYTVRGVVGRCGGVG